MAEPSAFTQLFTNNTEIIALANIPSSGVYRFTTDYLNYPTGWQLLVNLKWSQIPNCGCKSQNQTADHGIGGIAENYVGDTLYVVQYAPCGNANQILKYYLGGNYVVDYPQDFSVDIVGDFPWQGITQTWLREGDDHFIKTTITDQTGTYSWVGNGWEQIMTNNNNGVVLATANGFFVLQCANTFLPMSGAVSQAVGNLDFYKACVNPSISHLSTPDDGKTVYSVKQGKDDPNDCSTSSPNTHQ